MKWLGNVIENVLLGWIKWLLFKGLIYFPLTILNHIYSAFLYLSGSSVEQLLFGTTIDDSGKLKFNFFESNSPLKATYLVMIGISASVSAILLCISVIKNFTKGNGIDKIGGAITKVSGSILVTTVIPVVVVSFLSLSSTVVNVLGSKYEYGATQGDIDKAKNTLTDSLNKVYMMKKLSIFDYKNTFKWINYNGKDGKAILNNQSINVEKGLTIKDYTRGDYNNLTQNSIYKNIKGWQLVSGTTNSFTPSTNVNFVHANSEYKLLPYEKSNKIENYDSNFEHYNHLLENLQDLISNENPDNNQNLFVNAKIREGINNLLEHSNSLFENGHENNIFKKDGNKISWTDNVSTIFQNGLDALNKLSLGKDPAKSENVKVLSHKLEDIRYVISDWNNKYYSLIENFKNQYNKPSIENFLSAILREPGSNTAENFEKESKMVLSFINFLNLEDIYNHFFMKNVNESEVVSLNDIAHFIDKYVDNGINETFSNHKKVSLSNLVEIISSATNSDLVITLYQFATGKTNSDWTKIPRISEIDLGRIFVGSLVILVSIVIVFLIALFVARRIFDIATFFVLGPIFSVWSPVDDGKRFANWLEFMVERILSIIAILTALKIMNVLAQYFKKMLMSANFEGENISNKQTLVNTILLIFTIAGLISIYASTRWFSSIFKVNTFNLTKSTRKSRNIKGESFIQNIMNKPQYIHNNEMFSLNETGKNMANAFNSTPLLLTSLAGSSISTISTGATALFKNRSTTLEAKQAVELDKKDHDEWENFIEVL